MGVVVPFSAFGRVANSRRPRLDECGRVLLFDGVRIEREAERLDLAARRPSPSEAPGPGTHPGTHPGHG